MEIHFLYLHLLMKIVSPIYSFDSFVKSYVAVLEFFFLGSLSYFINLYVFVSVPCCFFYFVSVIQDWYIDTSIIILSAKHTLTIESFVFHSGGCHWYFYGDCIDM